jgi:ribokinase
VDDCTAESGRSIHMPLGAKLDVEQLSQELGGGAANSSVCFARLGFSAHVLARVGSDLAGDQAVERLARIGVGVGRVVRDASRPTSQSVVILAPGGDRTILAFRGSGAHFDVGDIDESWLRRAKWLYVTSLGGSLEALDKIFSVRKEHPVKIAWNPGALELAHGLQTLYRMVQQTDALLLNREEAAALTERPHATVEYLMSELISIVGTGHVVVTNAAEGAAAYDGVSVASVPGRQVDVIDTTGAGDAFGSGFVAAIMRGLSMDAALTFASANAESVIGKIGAQPGLLDRNEFERITEQTSGYSGDGDASGVAGRSGGSMTKS